MSLIIVITHPLGVYVCTDGTADVFETGVLTIQCLGALREFQPHEWRRATAYAADGYPEYAFRNDPKLRDEFAVAVNDPRR